MIGCRALIWIPRSLLVPDSVYLIAGIVVGLGLPLGIAILRGRELALRLAALYLLLGVLGICAAFAVSYLNVLPPKLPRMGVWSLPNLIIPLVLLVLLQWSRFCDNRGDVEPPGRSELRDEP